MSEMFNDTDAFNQDISQKVVTGYGASYTA